MSVARLRKLGTRCLATQDVTQSECLLEGRNLWLHWYFKTLLRSGRRCFLSGYCPVQGKKTLMLMF